MAEFYPGLFSIPKARSGASMGSVQYEYSEFNRSVKLGKYSKVKLTAAVVPNIRV
jgi:hypothetical protein